MRNARPGEEVVRLREAADINDPLPQAMKAIVGTNSGWLNMLAWLGLFGLVASFHAIILGYSRQVFALAREGFLPRPLARLPPGPPWRPLDAPSAAV